MGSLIMTLTTAVIFKGFKTKSRHWWTKWSDKRPCTCDLLWMNKGTGKRERRRKLWRELLLWISVPMLVRLSSNGWAMWLPDMTKIFVLSDDKMLPNRVAPSGSLLYNKISDNVRSIHIICPPEVPMHDPQWAIHCRHTWLEQPLTKPCKGQMKCGVQKMDGWEEIGYSRWRSGKTEW